MQIEKQGKSFTTQKDPAAVFLELTGGGYTVVQTARAMQLLREFNENGRVKYNGFIFTKGD